MKAKEIKTGDWVLANEEPIQIHDFLEDVVWFLDGSVSALMEDISPIPLTSEILEKNGWKFDDKEYDYRLKRLAIAPYLFKGKECFAVYAKDNNDCVNIHDIKYVHELQHLLWALGMDDDLKI